MTREQRTVFGEVAELYDRTRPGYPGALFETVMRFAGIGPGDRALEIGAGTGKATGGFAARGLDILALEPSPGMAEVLRRTHPSVLETSFEDWTVEPEAFALVYAAQSWHWVADHASAYTRVADALRPRGSVAWFWNLPQQFDGALGEEIEAVYHDLAPSLEPMTTQWPLDETLTELHATGLFERTTKVTLRSAQEYTTDEYVELMRTHSNHRMLDDDTLSRLQQAVREVVSRHPGELVVHYDVAVYLGSLA